MLKICKADTDIEYTTIFVSKNHFKIANSTTEYFCSYIITHSTIIMVLYFLDRGNFWFKLTFHYKQIPFSQFLQQY